MNPCKSPSPHTVFRGMRCSPCSENFDTFDQPYQNHKEWGTDSSQKEGRQTGKREWLASPSPKGCGVRGWRAFVIIHGGRGAAVEVPRLEKALQRRMPCVWSGRDQKTHSAQTTCRKWSYSPRDQENLGMMTANTLQISEAYLSCVISDGEKSSGWSYRQESRSGLVSG